MDPEHKYSSSFCARPPRHSPSCFIGNTEHGSQVLLFRYSSPNPVCVGRCGAGVWTVGRPGVYGREGRMRIRSFGSGMRSVGRSEGRRRKRGARFVEKRHSQILLFLCPASAGIPLPASLSSRNTSLFLLFLCLCQSEVEGGCLTVLWSACGIERGTNL